MYLRTTKRKNRDGTSVVYYQLAESKWNGERGHAEAKVVHNFGRGDQVDVEALRRLSESIRRVCGEGDPAPVASAKPGGLTLESLELLPAKAYGGVYAVQALWERLNVTGLIDGAGGKRGGRSPSHAPALFSMVANRLLAPTSKLSCYTWLQDNVYMPSSAKLKLWQLYSALDHLAAHADEIEKALFWRTADLFSFDVDLVFFDTTTAYFEIDFQDPGENPKDENGVIAESALRKRGYSKDKRPGNPQVVLALAVTRDGIPVRSWVFPGNTVDVTTIAKVREDLKDWKLTRVLFVGDAGMHSEQNKKILSSSGGRYLLATPIRSVKEVTEHVLKRAGRYKKIASNLSVKEVVVGEGEARRRYLVCKNDEQAVREKLHRDEILEELEVELKALAASKDAHPKSACVLLSSKRYGRYLKKRADGRLAIDLDKVRSEEKLDGKWVVTTNDDTLTAEDGAMGYKAAMLIEACFRRMKTTGLKLRPMFHWTQRRIIGHVKLCVLALLIQRLAEIRCQDTWRNISRELASIQALECVTPSGRFTKTTRPSERALTLLGRLDLKPPPKLLGLTTA